MVNSDNVTAICVALVFITLFLSVAGTVVFYEKVQTPLQACFDNCVSLVGDSRVQCTTMCARTFSNSSLNSTSVLMTGVSIH